MGDQLWQHVACCLQLLHPVAATKRTHGFCPFFKMLPTTLSINITIVCAHVRSNVCSSVGGALDYQPAQRATSQHLFTLPHGCLKQASTHSRVWVLPARVWVWVQIFLSFVDAIQTRFTHHSHTLLGTHTYKYMCCFCYRCAFVGTQRYCSWLQLAGCCYKRF